MGYCRLRCPENDGGGEWPGLRWTARWMAARGGAARLPRHAPPRDATVAHSLRPTTTNNWAGRGGAAGITSAGADRKYRQTFNKWSAPPRTAPPFPLPLAHPDSTPSPSGQAAQAPEPRSIVLVLQSSLYIDRNNFLATTKTNKKSFYLSIMKTLKLIREAAERQLRQPSSDKLCDEVQIPYSAQADGNSSIVWRM